MEKTPENLVSVILISFIIAIPLVMFIYIVAKHPEDITNPKVAKIFRNGYFCGGGRVINNSNNYIVNAIAVEDKGIHFYKILPHHSLGGWGTFIDIDGIYFDGNYIYNWRQNVYKGSNLSEDGIKIHDYQTITIDKYNKGAVYLSGNGRYIKNMTLLMTRKKHRNLVDRIIR